MLGSCLNFPRPESKTVRQLFEVIKSQDRHSWSVVWASQEHKCWAVVWTSHYANPSRWAVLLISRDSRLNTLRSWLNFVGLMTELVDQLFELPRPKSKTIRQLFELPKTPDWNCWAVVWTSQDKLVVQLFAHPKTTRLKKVGSCLKVPKTESRTIAQFFELFETDDWISSAIIWKSQYSRPKPLGSCLKLSRPKGRT